jgi:hypothetical protein
MKSTLLDERDGERTYAVVLSTGDEAVGALTAFAAQHLDPASGLALIDPDARQSDADS